MNNRLLFSFLVLIIVFVVSGCGKSGNETNHNASASAASAGQIYTIDTKESVITWKGSMLLASEEEHAGYVYLSKGELLTEKGQLVGGSAEIDMNSMEYKDKTNTNTPIKHLKSPDYFDVEKFPTSTIVITGVESESDKTLKITAKLTIKGVTRTVTFPAGMEVKDGVLNANGKLTIDRTDWGIRYNSGKFYDIVADQIVSDEIEFLIKIVAGK